jgi:DNA (cytosine-5)-methyltransferase 1
VFSFFAGAGFLDLGFEAEGFSVDFANEFNESFANAYAFSRESVGFPLPKYGIHTNSVEDWGRGKFSRRLAEWIATERKNSKSVGFIGGPPCPDFSVGGKNRGRHGDNGKLTEVFFQLIKKQLPDWFLFENVKGLWRTKTHRAFYDEMRALMHESGYATSDRLINALEYGVPQDRERIILVGLSPALAKRKGYEPGKPISTECFPWKIGRKFEKEFLSTLSWPLRSPFGNNPRRPNGIPLELTVKYWFDHNTVAEHPNSAHAFAPRAGLKRFLEVDEGDDSRKSFKRLHRWRYSPTACYGNNEVHLHPSEARRLNVAEVLAVQSLPREYALPQGMTLSAMFKTIGNGVPFLAARGLGKMIHEVLR